MATVSRCSQGEEKAMQKDKSSAMRPELAESGGGIEPQKLYQLEAAKACLGWGSHSLRVARRRGLKVIYVGRRGYVLGKDVIEYIERTGRDEK
jgi:hypothetical protein